MWISYRITGKGLGFEGQFGASLEDDVCAPPGIVSDQPPAMAGAGIVFGEQDIAWANGEALTASNLEFQHAAKGDDETGNRVLVPLEGAARMGFLKGDVGRAYCLTQAIAPDSIAEIYGPFFEMGIAVTTGPNANAAYHVTLLQLRLGSSIMVKIY
jgi:hypothetical protein